MPAYRIYWLETIASARRTASSPKADNDVRESLLTDPPDQQPARLELIVNAKTAKAPGPTIPRSMPASAYEVSK